MSENVSKIYLECPEVNNPKCIECNWTIYLFPLEDLQIFIVWGIFSHELLYTNMEINTFVHLVRNENCRWKIWPLEHKIEHWQKYFTFYTYFLLASCILLFWRPPKMKNINSLLKLFTYIPQNVQTSVKFGTCLRSKGSSQAEI